jgi:hypothetical protein
MWRILKQTFREFWLPLAMALAWTSYKVGLHGRLTDYISNFAASVFLSSWAVGQINRIRRDQKTNDAFASLEARLTALDVSMETISHWTGSFAKPNALASTNQLDAQPSPVSELSKTDVSELSKTGNVQTGGESNVISISAVRARRLAAKLNLIESRFDLDLEILLAA